MTQIKKDLPEISMSNTKKEMLSAFEELRNQLQQQSETDLKPEKKKEEIRKKEMIQKADEMTADNTTKKINELKMEIGKELSGISDQLEKEAANYLSLKESIEIKKKELKEIFEIEASAFALTALIETQRQKKLEFEQDISMKREALELEIQQKRMEWDKEKKEHEIFITERDADEKKKRERLKEEFNYNFNREQQLSRNEFNDQREKSERELTEAKEALDKNIIETENNLKEREEKVQERERKIDDLEKQVQEFPSQLESAVNKSVKEITEKLIQDAQKNEALLKKEYEGEKNVLKTKIDNLEKLVEQQKEQIENISQQLEKSYTKVQDIALKAIEGSTSSQRISAIENQLLLEKKSMKNIEVKN